MLLRVGVHSCPTTFSLHRPAIARACHSAAFPTKLLTVRDPSRMNSNRSAARGQLFRGNGVDEDLAGKTQKPILGFGAGSAASLRGAS